MYDTLKHEGTAKVKEVRKNLSNVRTGEKLMAERHVIVRVHFFFKFLDLVINNHVKCE